ncbi:unnamed protein product, partial [Rotaria sp. Silwood1]
MKARQKWGLLIPNSE